MQKRLIRRNYSFALKVIRSTPVARLEVLHDVHTARVERGEQDLMVWNVTPVDYNYVVSVVLQYERRLERWNKKIAQLDIYRLH